MRILGTAASGIRAQQVALDTVANNLANVNTPGFKEEHVSFAETLAAEVRPAGTTMLNGAQTGEALNVGSGVLYNGVGTVFRQGTFTLSDNPLDLAIDGQGFFQVRTPSGQIAYSRMGAFRVDASGQLVDEQGNLLEPAVTVPAGASDISVSPDGQISGLLNGERTIFGQIMLARFTNPDGLEKIGGSLFLPTANSGAPQSGQPGTGNLGTIRAQALEQSNVNLAAAMTDLLQAQRAYQMNARLVQDGDKMWGLANTLRR